MFPDDGIPDADLPAAAAALLRDYPPSSLPEYADGDQNFAGWAGEGFTAAVTLAYTLPVNSTVSVAYRATVQDTVRRRIALGGYRLAAILRRAVPAAAAGYDGCDASAAVAALGALAGVLGVALAAIGATHWWRARLERAGLAQFRDLEEFTSPGGIELGLPPPRRR